jgi:outer membrane protein assembly factor BamA
MSLGIRSSFEYIHAYAGSKDLPIFEKLFLGGEYSVRGFDIRSIGPHDAASGLVLGGNKSLLFNFEQNFNIVSQVRIIAFFDAGQVRDEGQNFVWKEQLTKQIVDPAPATILSDPFSAGVIALFGPTHLVTSREYAFKASTGLELRFFMPVLNVPFRLIMAYNPSAAGVLDNTLQPQQKFQFRFAVGTTF